MNPSTQREWIEPESPDIPDEVLVACEDDALIASILVNRGLTDPAQIRAFLDPEQYQHAPPEALPDLAQASELLQRAIASGQRILVWGDFDVDGQTATALLTEGLTRLGADVAFHIPRRDTESHGISVRSLKRELSSHSPGVLLTCDTGISEYKAIAHARAAGLTVIVTDHHALSGELPDADAVVNPKRLSPDHPLGALPGVGVVYKLMQHLYTTLGRSRELPRLLDLVALGIVADIATQVRDTRYLLQIGMERLRHTERIGLLALMEVAGVQPESLTTEQIGFQLGPRMNAVGRMDDASLSVELLTTRDRARAYVIAQQMEGLNNERRLIARQIEDAAEDLLSRDRSLLDHEVLVIYQPGWHMGILGMVANRLAERYHRPTVLLSGDAQQEIAAGSARSVGGYDIHAALAAQSDVLRTFGGHPGAAGLSLPVSNVDVLRRRLSQDMGAAPIAPPLSIDAVLGLEALDESLYYRLARLSPFGEGNPAPTLVTRDVHLSHAGIIGRDQRHRRLVVEDDQGRMQAVLWWGGASSELPEGTFDIAYTLSRSDRGEIDAVLVDYRETSQPAVEIAPEPAIKLIDWRRDPDPLARLEIVRAENPGALVWAEAYARQGRPDWRRRAELVPAPTLIIYTAPPDPATLEAALATVQPEAVHVLAVQPPLDTFEAFLKQLVSAVQNAVQHLGGLVALDVLCGATAQSRQVVRAGLDYLAEEGQWSITYPAEGMVQIEIASQPASRPDRSTEQSARLALDKLRRSYEEVQAYRRFFRSLPLRKLFSAS
jgi:single-stranded-DNA-specific exonuclease